MQTEIISDINIPTRYSEDLTFLATNAQIWRKVLFFLRQQKCLVIEPKEN